MGGVGRRTSKCCQCFRGHKQKIRLKGEESEGEETKVTNRGKRKGGNKGH